jgi:tight adherence protein B
MESQILPYLIATSVGLVVLFIASLLKALLNPEKRKLAERLASDVKSGAGATGARSAITLETELPGLSAQLARVPIFEKLNRMVIQAFPNVTLAQFVFFAALFALVALVIAMSLFDSVIIGVLVGAGVAYIPIIVLNAKRNRRQRAISLQLPGALDFLSRILRAGHSLSTGLQMMADELPRPLCEEFRRCYDQHSLGLSMDDALKDMVARIESTDFAFFVTAVLIQRQTGGDLSEVLNNISGMIRQRIRLQQHVKAKTAEGRFTGYILSAFPAVMFVIAATLNPEYAGVLWKTNEGMGLLGVAFGLTVIGLYAIKKITTVRV